ncbi:hypothetical protein MIND_00376900 [Mycena indigotica]|uniref:DUF6534 domain-containing protein n=1 Tax=Mycena indigotica TaxID=2126181 RepID=A0A8H6T356_9AGAR|nr:uncharacterized protein MIND_00376900 [Mycena indigotica]KAF7310039.1 hypothetical protein MIND_00376900 [Mycena indigotica]
MDAFHTFGGYLVGSWIASLLYGSALIQAVRYFSGFPDDTWLRKGTVILALVFGLVALIADYGNVYIPLVLYWGNTSGPTKIYWSIPTYGPFNAAVGVVVNTYLITRFWSLSKNIIITIILSVLVLLSASYSDPCREHHAGDHRGYFSRGSLIDLRRWSLSLTIRDRAQCEPEELFGPSHSLLVSTDIDVAIAAALVWKLKKMKSAFKSTNGLIHRLIIGAVQTGATTAALALLLLAFFLLNPTNSVSSMFLSTLGPCYLHTLFINFNSRRAANGTSGASRTTSDSRPHINTILVDGIQVHRTAIVTMDPPEVDNNGRSRRIDIESVGVDGDSYSGQKVSEL